MHTWTVSPLCSSAGYDSVPGGLLRQIVHGCVSDEWFADEKNTAALTVRDGVWVQRQ